MHGKVILVTGGTRGMGAAIVETLRSAGARVFTTARSHPDTLAEPDDFVAADISTIEGSQILAEAASARLGQIDAVVHVVGGSSALPGHPRPCGGTRCRCRTA